MRREMRQESLREARQWLAEYMGRLVRLRGRIASLYELGSSLKSRG